MNVLNSNHPSEQKIDPVIKPGIFYPNLHLKQEPYKKDFSTYLFQDNKIYSLLIIFLVIGQFIIFKLLYPYPDFFSDSYSYIDAAYRKMDVNIWPIGYSKFLAGFHWFTRSDTALILFQYLFLELSFLLLYHTIVYFYATGKNTRTALCLFLFFSPLNLYVANYVTSDAIFIELSTLWLTIMIWTIHRPKTWMILAQAIIFFIAFTFRYNAMYYPLIGAVVYFLSNQPTWKKAFGTLIGPVLIIPFIIFSSNAAKELTGTQQFPPILGGWQWGNNALYMRGFITEDSAAFPTNETRKLDGIAQRYFGQPSRPQDLLSSYVANFFIREPEAPLKQYMLQKYGNTKDYGSVQQWGMVAPVFKDYGLFLIKRHPWAYAQHYLLVNTKNYFLPPLEKLEIYNLGMDEVWPIAAYWFNYPTLKITAISWSLQGKLLFVFTALFAVLNLYFLVVMSLMARKGNWKKADRNLRKIIFVVCLFVALNFAFSVFANIIVIRYQIFPMIVLFAFTLLITDHLELSIWGYQPKTSKEILQGSVDKYSTSNISC